MNKQNINKKPLRGFLGVCAVAALAAAILVTTAGIASAGDYGQGAVYQVALTAEDPPGGGGIWLWLALYQDTANGGHVDYTGADCAGGVNGQVLGFFQGAPNAQQAGAPFPIGAAADTSKISGDAAWKTIDSYTDPCTGVTYSPAIEIDNVVLRGFCPDCFTTTIYVPATYGHYTSTGYGFNTIPPPQCAPYGFTQLTVASGQPGTSP